MNWYKQVVTYVKNSYVWDIVGNIRSLSSNGDQLISFQLYENEIFRGMF